MCQDKRMARRLESWEMATRQRAGNEQVVRQRRGGATDALISEESRQYGNVNEDMSAGQAERAEGQRHGCTGPT